MPAGFTSVRLLLCYNFYEDFFRSLLTCTQRIALLQKNKVLISKEYLSPSLPQRKKLKSF